MAKAKTVRDVKKAQANDKEIPVGRRRHPRESRKAIRETLEAAVEQIVAAQPVVETPAAATKEASAVSQPKAAAKPNTKPSAQAKATATGAKYHVLAGRPSKQGVVAVFGKTGYGLSWVARAAKLAMTADDLTAIFATDPQRVKIAWAALDTAKDKK